MDEDSFPRPDRIFVDFDAVNTVLKFVFLPNRRSGEFPGFSHRNKSGTELVRKNCSKDEPARFDSDDLVDCHGSIMVPQEGNSRLKCGRILEQGRNIFENNPLLWKVRDGTNVAGEVFYQRTGSFFRKASIPFLQSSVILVRALRFDA